jgi:FAD dependent oxidoreductase
MTILADMASVETVLIVGGGIAGLTLAAALHRQGCKIDLIERNTAWHTTGAGIGGAGKRAKTATPTIPIAFLWGALICGCRGVNPNRSRLSRVARCSIDLPGAECFTYFATLFFAQLLPDDPHGWITSGPAAPERREDA